MFFLFGSPQKILSEVESVESRPIDLPPVVTLLQHLQVVPMESQWKSMEIDRWTEIFSVGFGIACCEKLTLLFQNSMKTTMELVSCWTLLNSCSFLRFQARHRVMTWHLSWRSGNHWPLLVAVTVAIREQCENVTKQPLMSSRIERTQYIYTHQISQLYYILICIYINIHIYSYTYICYIYIIYIYWESTGENRNP